jgi:hypothetical protein
MTNSNSIGLAELIENVKQDLLNSSYSDKETNIPLLYIESVELELKVTVNRGVKGGIDIKVLSLGSDASQNEAQTVKVKLSPLLSKEALQNIYLKQHPDKLEDFKTQSFNTILRGDDDL